MIGRSRCSTAPILASRGAARCGSLAARAVAAGRRVAAGAGRLPIAETAATPPGAAAPQPRYRILMSCPITLRRRRPVSGATSRICCLTLVRRGLHRLRGPSRAVRPGDEMLPCCASTVWPPLCWRRGQLAVQQPDLHRGHLLGLVVAGNAQRLGAVKLPAGCARHRRHIAALLVQPLGIALFGTP